MAGATKSPSTVTVPATLIEGLELDRKRLDWLEANEVELVRLEPTHRNRVDVWLVSSGVSGFGSTLREAIDAAIASSEAEGGE